MKITWYGHSCFKIETGASIVLVDPFLKGNPTFENSGVSWDDATAGVTHVALTHGHDDHLGDTAEILEKRGATLFAVFEIVSHLGADKAEPMNTGGTVKAADFSITLVNALHSSSSNGVYLGNPCGLVLLDNAGKSVYHMGDTEVFSDMELIQELHEPTIGIVPIGDRFTMGAKSAAFACKKYFSFQTIFPCHYGTFPIIDQTADAFVSEMSGHNVVVPKPGEAIDV